jgi:transcription termination factor Rho
VTNLKDLKDNTMNEYNSLLKQSLDLKQKRDDKYKEVSKDRLFQIGKKKVQTTMIGALDTIEKSFGFLWQAEGEPTQEQVQLKSIFENARSEILDRGNTQIRNLEAEISNYDISWKRYTVSLPIKEKGEEDGR